MILGCAAALVIGTTAPPLAPPTLYAGAEETGAAVAVETGSMPAPAPDRAASALAFVAATEAHPAFVIDEPVPDAGPTGFVPAPVESVPETARVTPPPPDDASGSGAAGPRTTAPGGHGAAASPPAARPPVSEPPLRPATEVPAPTPTPTPPEPSPPPTPSAPDPTPAPQEPIPAPEPTEPARPDPPPPTEPQPEPDEPKEPRPEPAEPQQPQEPAPDSDEPQEPAPDPDEPTEPEAPAPDPDEPTEPEAPAPDPDEPREPEEPAPDPDVPERPADREELLERLRAAWDQRPGDDAELDAAYTAGLWWALVSVCLDAGEDAPTDEPTSCVTEANGLLAELELPAVDPELWTSLAADPRTAGFLAGRLAQGMEPGEALPPDELPDEVRDAEASS